jgi:hypothetical protein
MRDKVMGKQKSCTYKSFVAPNSNHTFGKSGSATQEPGQTGTTRGSPSSFGAKGGSGHMVGKQTVKASKPL